MASLGTKFEYVKNFERDDRCLPNSWIIVRVDGKSFGKFTEQHGFEKPNDKLGFDLMTRAAVNVMEELRDICLAYGHTDEYSFVFRKDTSCFNRRSAKIMSTVNSIFSSAYVYYWKDIFGVTQLKYPPGFESVIVVYPSEMNLKDYLCWRQSDLQMKNTYNTIFWALVKKGSRTEQEAHEILRNAGQKTEMLFREFGMNYYNEPELYRKGTTLIRKLIPSPADGKLRQFILSQYCDLTGDEFWKENPEILGLKSLQVYHRTIHTNIYMVNKPNTAVDKMEDSNMRMETNQ
ncbi:hypothetical protein PGB90_008916 [Kerria lacca]